MTSNICSSITQKQIALTLGNKLLRFDIAGAAVILTRGNQLYLSVIRLTLSKMAICHSSSMLGSIYNRSHPLGLLSID